MLNIHSAIRLFLALVLLALCSGIQAQPKLEVFIDGVDEKALENVQKLLGIDQQKGSELLVDGRIHRLHQKAPAEIRRALEPFGFYRVTLDASLELEEGVWKARYHIDSGEPVPILLSDILITGEAAENMAFVDLIKASSLLPGKPFTHIDYTKLKRDLQDLADNQGYFEAIFTQQEVQIDLKSYHASIHLHLDSGPRYRFGAISFSGVHPFNDAFLSRYLGFSSGDHFQQSHLADQQKRLIASGYFEAVDIQAPREPNPSARIPVNIHLQQRNRNRYQLGFGYGTDTGVRGMAGYERRWLNQNGHRLSTELHLSEIKNRITVLHTIPLARPVTDRLVTQANYEIDKGGDVDSRKLKLGSSIERARGVWVQQWGVSYQLEDFTIGLQSGNSNLLIPATRWTSIRGYDFLNLLRGLRFGIELRGASAELFSDTDFSQLRMDIKALLPAGKGRFLLRGEAGATAVADITQLPPSLRFFAGGDYSIRGFAYRTVGPTDASGEVVGGRHLLTGSIEYEHPLDENWSAALFLDGGDAFDEQFTKAEKGAGIGFRRALPIGQLRIDLAQAITRDNRPWRLHLTMGLEL